MKRIVGRKYLQDQVDQYSEMAIEQVPPDAVMNNGIVSVPFRFKWASDTVDNLLKNGLVCYNYLDIGTYNGLMAFMMAMKFYTPNVDRVSVDAVEAHKQSFESANATAKVLADRGLRIEVHNVKFEDYETDKLYDVITAFEILEHTRDPLFCIEKVYDLLQVGGHFMLTVPEQHGRYGLGDKNQFHYWVSTVQSLVYMFNDERKWRIKQIFENGDLIHMLVQKRSYME